MPYTHQARKGRAKNQYRQVRLSYTEEASGRISVSLYVKPLGEAWNEQQCLGRWTVEGEPGAGSVEHVALRLIYILQSAFPEVTPAD